MLFLVALTGIIGGAGQSGLLGSPATGRAWPYLLAVGTLAFLLIIFVMQPLILVLEEKAGQPRRERAPHWIWLFPPTIGVVFGALFGLADEPSSLWFLRGFALGAGMIMLIPLMGTVPFAVRGFATRLLAARGRPPDGESDTKGRG